MFDILNLYFLFSRLPTFTFTELITLVLASVCTKLADARAETANAKLPDLQRRITVVLLFTNEPVVVALKLEIACAHYIKHITSWCCMFKAWHFLCLFSLCLCTLFDAQAATQVFCFSVFYSIFSNILIISIFSNIL